MLLTVLATVGGGAIIFLIQLVTKKLKARKLRLTKDIKEGAQKEKMTVSRREGKDRINGICYTSE